MHVPSYQRYASVLCLAIAAFAGGAQAVDFDEKLKAPQAKGAAEIKSLAENYSANFARLEAASPVESVTSPSLYLEYFDLRWQITQAIDQKRPINDLSAVGLEKRDDGSITIDLQAYPQWDPFAKKLASLMPNMNLDNLAPLLINRGFRQSDLDALKNYIATNNLKAAVSAKTLPIAISFSKVVKKLDRLKMPVSNSLVFSYIYQRNKASALVERDWAEGLVQVLDAQRVRVLHSYFSELKARSTWAPSDVEGGIAGLLAALRLPDYEQRATAEAKGETP